MIEVVQVFDRTPIARLDSDDSAALDRKIEAARRLFADRGAWLKTHQRMEILRKLAGLMEGKREHLGHQIAREGGKPLTDALIETDRAIDFLSFIGSSRVGWSLRSKLPLGTRCALEHGGAAPAIIDRSADLDRLIEPLAKGGYYHAGQVCVSVQRIYVHADLERAFL